MAAKAAKTKTATKKTAAKAVKAAETTTFTTDSLARAISAKSAVDGKPAYSITEANEIVNLVKEAITDAVKAGQKVQITGFLSIVPSYRAEREGNNVLTGESMTIPAAVVLNVKAGKGLKDAAKETPAAVVEALKAEKEAKAK